MDPLQNANLTGHLPPDTSVVLVLVLVLYYISILYSLILVDVKRYLTMVYNNQNR